jgi:hypothetical protein
VARDIFTTPWPTFHQTKFKKAQFCTNCSDFFQVFHNKINPELLTAIFKNTKKENSHEKINRHFGPVVLRFQH